VLKHQHKNDTHLRVVNIQFSKNIALIPPPLRTKERTPETTVSFMNREVLKNKLRPGRIPNSIQLRGF
jgi:hypothetical protein